MHICIQGAKGEHANGSFTQKRPQGWILRKALPIQECTQDVRPLWPGFIGGNSTGREEEF